MEPEIPDNTRSPASETFPTDAVTDPATDVKFAPVASYRHTALFLILLCVFAFLSAKLFAMKQPGDVNDMTFHIGKYLPTLIWQWIMFGLTYAGLKQKGVRLKEIMGGWWSSIEEFLLDVVIAFGFFVVALFVLFLVQKLILPPEAMDGATRFKSLAPLAPHSVLDLVFFILIAISAGIVEETVFRGYFQRQFSALTHSIFIGMFLSSALFGFGHLYQGALMTIVLGIYGFMFATLAQLRGNIRPGMLAHMAQDSFSGVMLFFIARHPEWLELAKHKP